MRPGRDHSRRGPTLKGRSSPTSSPLPPPTLCKLAQSFPANMMPKSASATQNVFSFFGSSSKSRPGTSSGESSQQPPFLLQQPQPNVPAKDRKGSFPRKASFTSPTRSSKKRSGSSGSVSGRGGGFVTDSSAPPALPDYALSAAAKVTREGDAATGTGSGDGFPKMLGRTATTSSFSGGSALNPPSGHMWQGEAAVMHKNMREIARKRIYTLDYIRKAYVPTLFRPLGVEGVLG